MAKPLSTHVYRDPDDDEPFARKLKFSKNEPGPNFKWEHRIGWDAERDWAPGLPKGLDVGLYGQGHIERAKSRRMTVHITEGEKDADRFAKEYPDRVVVSRPHGARSWSESWHRMLRGVPHIVIHADDDEVGVAGAARAAHALKADGFESVRIALPAEGCKDVFDHLEAGQGDGFRVLRESDWPVEKHSIVAATNAPVDPDKAVGLLLGKAMQLVLTEGRNDTGFGLATQLRDAGLPSEKAERVLVDQYVPAANALAPKPEPYTAAEAREAVRQAYREPARSPSSGLTETTTWDDFGNAQRLVDMYGDRLRWVADIKHWAVYEKKTGLWILRSEERAVGLARKVIERAEHEEAEQYSDAPGSGSKGEKSTARGEFRDWVRKQRSAERVSAMLRLAKSKLALKRVIADFDGRADLLHCANGVLDLKSRELLPFSPEHLCTVSTHTAYVPGSRDGLWDSYLDVFLPDLKLRKFVQRVFGYTLIEGNPERLFALVCGGTSSGKSTINEAVMAAIGEYARPFNMTVFRANKDEKPRSDVANILHRRYVSTVEASADWHLHADQIKRVTGGDKLAARYPYDRADTIRVPAFAPFIFTNAVPTIEGRDKALDRRLIVLPFEQTVSPANDVRGAREKLAGTESAKQAVLAWLVEGLAEYLAEGGFGPMPKVVKAAIEDAKFSFSDLDRFFKDRCEFGDDYECRPAEIYQAYRSWCLSQSIADRDILSGTKFGIGLSNRDFEKVKGRRDVPSESRPWVRRGLRLREPSWKP